MSTMWFTLAWIGVPSFTALMAGAVLGWIGRYLAGAAYGREVFPGGRWWFLTADLPDICSLRNLRFATQMLGAA